MTESDRSSLIGRGLYAVGVGLVAAFFLVTLRDILNPFLLFLALALLLSPFAGTRGHLLSLATAGLLTLIWALSTTGFLLAPFFLSLVFAYIFHPVVEKIQGPRIPRTAAIGLLTVPMLGLLALALFVGIPALSTQVAHFIERIPALVQSTVSWAEAARVDLLRRDVPYVDEDVLLGSLSDIQPAEVIDYIQARQADLAQRVWAGILGAGRGISTVLTILGYLVLTPILSFYLLRDYDALVARMASLVPRTHAAGILSFAREYDRLLSRYLRGQLLAAAVVGVLTGIGFWIVGFPYALLLGVVAGVFNVVPYLGLLVSLIPALVIALFSGAILLSLAKIAGVFAVIQLLDGAVIGPRIVGESVGLHPVWVILALTVFGFFWGFVGLLLAIPLAVLVKLLLNVAIDRYQRSTLFRGEVDTTESP
ncbi:MAG TPA: AI-2E family transporter [Longimicrobiaceae bacterium]|nr:AI-2E family transporter [Longimicrobiaceae bacterium]